ncbi:6-bladed beta-propeller [Leptodesmis sp.]|uniref:6-bladed beta-propeller n=1 Tax=Leptodesmis sp. TaxID=3100501 RepID=UPI004053537E
MQKFDTNGRFLKQWGSCGVGDGQFQEPSGIAIDGSGYVYVSDTYNNRIQKFDADGNFLGLWTQWGDASG